MIYSVTTTYDIVEFMERLVKGEILVGDRVLLPDFSVPAVTIDGKEKMDFEELEVDEYAVVYNIDKDGSADLVFERTLLSSAVDFNGSLNWTDTQLCKYLSGAFLSAMKDSGIPAAECGLLRKKDLFGEDALPFFKIGRNRVCFDIDEDYSIWYWLEDKYEAPAANFCCVNGLGTASYYSASLASYYVRPRFRIQDPAIRGALPRSGESGSES